MGSKANKNAARRKRAVKWARNQTRPHVEAKVRKRRDR